MVERNVVVKQSVSRLEFLDGFRSVMTLMVLLWHVCSTAQAPPCLLKLFCGGYWHVSAFFVLSGFVLYLPSAGRERIETSRRFPDYMKRRVSRLAPPYYAAITLSFLVPFLLARASIISPQWASLQQAASFLWHLPFLHTWNKELWMMTNGSCWMLGYEWILCLSYPLFIYVARKGGWVALLGLVVVLRLIYPAPIGGLLQTFFQPTYTFCFVIGMMFARLSRGPDGITGMGRQKASTLLLFTFVISIVVAVLLAQMQRHTIFCSWLIGLAVASFLSFMAFVPASLPARLLSVRPLKALSTFSYSVFLTNSPLLCCASWLARKLELTGILEFYFVFVPAIPLIIGLAYLFHCIFERPYQRSQHQSISEAAMSVRNALVTFVRYGSVGMNYYDVRQTAKK